LIESDIITAVREAGVVGAGGAGFPTHFKLKSAVNTAIANGAECEPLLAHDKALMTHQPQTVIEGLSYLAQAVSAKRKIIAVKKKYAFAIDALGKHSSTCEILFLPDYYPVGDEVEIVKIATGKIVPEEGLPLEVGAVVDNVETLANIANAMKGEPVVARWVTVCGEVKIPKVMKVPIGSKVSDVVLKCGGSTIAAPVYYVGGPMMGSVVGSDFPISKTTTGVFLLPHEHPLIQKRALRMEWILRQAQSVCTDCRLCTDSCPRFLLGHSIEPHKIMRAVNLALEGRTREVLSAHLCCFCGVCEYACPMMLSPRRIYEKTLEYLNQEGIAFPRTDRILNEHPMRALRRLPSGRLLSRLGLSKYNSDIEYDKTDWAPVEVSIPLKQHIGVPAKPVVEVGDKVLKGQVLGEIPEGKLSARVHASIDGQIIALKDEKITVRGN
jgi:Na+-translocating ferredoxin:NAD+ oxidoreductase RnfC subunit